MVNGDPRMEQLARIIILGIIQGLTEWLPISSTGHLKLAESILGLEAPILFDVTLHAGTIIVILVFFRSDIRKVLAALAQFDFRTEDGRLIPLIIVGTVPTAIIGLFLGDAIENTFRNLSAIAVAFIICGVILYIARTGKEEKDKITYMEAIAIGLAQGIAIIPGFSRSGITIATALTFGIKREKAFKFSFLLSVPAVIGALGLTIYTQHHELASAGLDWVEIIAGMTVAMVVGYFALKLLWRTLKQKKFHIFASYCWVLGAAVIALELGGF